MTRVKICGITNQVDADMAVSAGADALGFIFFPGSPRHVEPDTVRSISERLPPFISVVGVFVNEIATQVNDLAAKCRLDTVQLHGDETPEYCADIDKTVVKVFRVKNDDWLRESQPYRVSALLLDTWASDRYGGTGNTFDWSLVSRVSHPVILSGGLNPGNVADAISKVKPYGVDTSSGVESEPGIKDHKKVQEFIEAVRQTDALS
ncbi:MAG: phosphoribosylanthranilate isomerase [Candidatus Latescibacteria bacterium]|jgi:phosphoribosylanthranilate isomerase|nr:phosphoribosylanthranilate isomerase [Candidatus Latescibacterota bacterium]